LTDGVIQVYGGKILIHDDAGIATAEACRCVSEAPCEDCAGAEPNATVEVNPAATCDADCYLTAGEYAFSAFEPNAFGGMACRWTLTKGIYTLWFWVIKASGVWGAELYETGTANIFAQTSVYPEIICVGGALEGTFDLDGSDLGDQDCTLCTFTATLT